jgi:hypothetical protein
MRKRVFQEIPDAELSLVAPTNFFLNGPKKEIKKLERQSDFIDVGKTSSNCEKKRYPT